MRAVLRAAFLGGGALGEMILCHLQVMLDRDGFCVPDPGTDNVNGERLSQLRFPACPQILEQLGPGFQTGPTDDPVQLGPKIAVSVEIAVDDVLGTFLSKFDCFFEVWAPGNRQRLSDRLPRRQQQ